MSTQVIFPLKNKDQFSLIGDFGRNLSWLGYKDLLDKYGVSISPIAAGENKSKLSPFEHFKEKDGQWIQGFLNTFQDNLKKEILGLRGENFNKAGLTSAQIEKKIFGGQDLRACELQQLGYIDDVQNYDEIKDHLYADYKTQRIHIPAYVNWGLGNLGRLNEKEQILANRLLSQ